jgi:benzoyl-CoA reductase/2-hydroxyglutaryl-CoA dehydratase subunit BcrC/BadD/HgdB
MRSRIRSEELKSMSSSVKDSAGSAVGSIKSGAGSLWTYLKSASRETIASDLKDTWLLWRTVFRVYIKAGKAVLQRGPRIILDLKQYPWLVQIADLRSFFRAVRGRKGNYRKALLMVLEDVAAVSVQYLVDVLSNPDRVIYFQSAALGLTELCRAMDLIPFMDLAPPVVSVLINPRSMEKYMDIAESEGVPSDACSLFRSSQALLFSGQAPKAAAIVGNDMCEGQVNASLLYTKMTGLPTFTFTAPNNFNSERAEEWGEQEVMRLVEWLEENTPGKMDWDRLREICEEKNRAIEAEMELWEMMRLQPAPLAAEAIWFSHLICAAMMGGTKEATKMFETLAELAKENMKKGVGACPDERYRAVIWHMPMGAHWHIYRYLELKWGVSVIQDSMAYNELGFVDTSSKESILRDVGRQIMHTPMAIIARGPGEYYLDPLFRVIKHWDINLVLVGDHIGCKSTSAMVGMLRDRCRKEGIPLIAVPYDLMDTRFASWEEVRNAFDQFMETIMNVEPLREKIPAV